MLSVKQQEELDQKILETVQAFLNFNCRITDMELSKLLGVSSSSIGRYLTGERVKVLIGIDNYAYIKRERLKNKELGRKLGGSKKKNG